MPVLDRGREAEVLAKKESMLKNPYLKTEVKDFFSSIMAISRRQQRALLAQQSSVEQVRALQALVQNAREPVSMPQVFYQGVAEPMQKKLQPSFLGKRPSAAAPPPGVAFLNSWWRVRQIISSFPLKTTPPARSMQSMTCWLSTAPMWWESRQ